MSLSKYYLSVNSLFNEDKKPVYNNRRNYNLSEDTKRFNELVYLQKDMSEFRTARTGVGRHLIKIKKELRLKNNKVKPFKSIFKYMCKTCGSLKNEWHPKTGACYYCGTENVEELNY